jgi:hypothetical protein
MLRVEGRKRAFRLGRLGSLGRVRLNVVVGMATLDDRL